MVILTGQCWSELKSERQKDLAADFFAVTKFIWSKRIVYKETWLFEVIKYNVKKNLSCIQRREKVQNKAGTKRADLRQKTPVGGFGQSLADRSPWGTEGTAEGFRTLQK